MLEFFNKLDRKSRLGMLVGAVMIIGLTIFVGTKILSPDYRVLFNGLAAQDAAAMVEELDKLKVPYRLADEGSTILVDQVSVLQTRMKLMGRDLPLKGAVGFELFNQSDFGMTEFAQRVNYQRALQGELTRTIKSLSQVRDARVMLVLPEKGLFKQASSKAKASVTLVTDPGRTLRPDQVQGIQRLVSASAPGIGREDVMVLDQNGVALSRDSGSEDELGSQGSGRLDLKKETEAYLSRKATDVLEKLFGDGQAVAAVDVVLNPDKSQVTIEDLIVPPGRAGQTPTGVIVREKESIAESGSSGDGRTPEEAAATRVGRSQKEVEYAVGRRVEQVVSQAGSIRRLQAVAVIRRPTGAQELEQVRKLLAATVGASMERGDTVIVQVQASHLPQDATGNANTDTPANTLSAQGIENPERPSSPETTWSQRLSQYWAPYQWAVLLTLTLLVTTGVVLLANKTTGVQQHSKALTPQQRQAALNQIRAWMAQVDLPEKIP